MTGQLIQFPGTPRERLLNTSELCEILGFSERWVRYRLAEGMPHRKWGRSLRFSLDEVERWLNERSEGNGAA